MAQAGTAGSAGRRGGDYAATVDAEGGVFWLNTNHGSGIYEYGDASGAAFVDIPFALPLPFPVHIPVTQHRPAGLACRTSATCRIEKSSSARLNPDQLVPRGAQHRREKLAGPGERDGEPRFRRGQG